MEDENRENAKYRVLTRCTVNLLVRDTLHQGQNMPQILLLGPSPSGLTPWQHTWKHNLAKNCHFVIYLDSLSRVLRRGVNIASSREEVSWITSTLMTVKEGGFNSYIMADARHDWVENAVRGMWKQLKRSCDDDNFGSNDANGTVGSDEICVLGWFCVDVEFI